MTFNVPGAFCCVQGAGGFELGIGHGPISGHRAEVRNDSAPAFALMNHTFNISLVSSLKTNNASCRFGTEKLKRPSAQQNSIRGAKVSKPYKFACRFRRNIGQHLTDRNGDNGGGNDV